MALGQSRFDRRKRMRVVRSLRNPRLARPLRTFGRRVPLARDNESIETTG